MPLIAARCERALRKTSSKLINWSICDSTMKHIPPFPCHADLGRSLGRSCAMNSTVAIAVVAPFASTAMVSGEQWWDAQGARKTTSCCSPPSPHRSFQTSLEMQGLYRSPVFVSNRFLIGGIYQATAGTIIDRRTSFAPCAHWAGTSWNSCPGPTALPQLLGKEGVLPGSLNVRSLFRFFAMLGP